MRGSPPRDVQDGFQQRILQVGDVLDDQIDTLLDLALLERVQDALVLGLRALGEAGQPDQGDLIAAQRDLQLGVQARQVTVDGERDQPVVKPERGPVPRPEVLRDQRGAGLRDGVPQGSDGVRRQPVGRAPDAVRLDHEPDVEDLLQVLIGEGPDVRAAVWLDRDEPFRFENADGLAHRRTAERQLPHQLCLVETFAGSQDSFDDGLPEVPGDFDGQRRRLLEDVSRHACPHDLHVSLAMTAGGMIGR